MVIESSLANIVISNNTIDQGRFSDGVAPIAYNYDFNAWIFGSANITGNSFLSSTTSTDILNLDTCSCTVTNNKFVRGSTSINSYIRSYGPNDQFITNNLFDSTTVNGSSLILVAGITTTSVYTKNKNQTGYLYVPIFDNSSGILGLIDAFNQTTLNDYTLGQSKFGGLGTQLIFKSGAAVNFSRNFNIGTLLEPGAKIKEIKLGTFISTGTVTPSSSQLIAMNIFAPANDQYMDVQNTFSTPPTLTTFGTDPQYIIDSSGKFTNITASTQYITYTPISTNPYFTVGKDYQLYVRLRISVTFDAANWTMLFSPFKITYVW